MVEKAETKNQNAEKNRIAKDLRISVGKKNLESLKEKAVMADQYFERSLRLQAELDNLRKRVEKERIEFTKYANEKMLLDLLPVMEHFNCAVASVKESHDVNAVLQGIIMIKHELWKVLKIFGLEEMNSVGEKFDPHRHEAVEIMDGAEEQGEDIVVEEVQKGYLLKGKVVKPAVVKVKKGQNGEDVNKEQEGDGQERKGEG